MSASDAMSTLAAVGGRIFSKGGDDDERVNDPRYRMSPIHTTRFTEFMLRENGLERRGFHAWVFLPGMLFNAHDKWWGDKGKRTRPHEGLDVGLFSDRQGRFFRLEEETKIPAMYGGTVVAIVDDFLGMSIVLEHRLPDSGGPFLTIYGHTVVREGLRPGSAGRERSSGRWPTPVSRRCIAIPICTYPSPGHRKALPMTASHGKISIMRGSLR